MIKLYTLYTRHLRTIQIIQSTPKAEHAWFWVSAVCLFAAAFGAALIF